MSDRMSQVTRQTLTALLLTQMASGVDQPIRAERRTSMLGQSASTALSFLEDIFSVYIPHLLIFLFVLFLGLVLTRVVPAFVDIILARILVPRHYRIATRYVLSTSIFIASLWLALAVVGIDFFAILVTFGVFSLVISVGISNVVSNVIAGITIQIEDLAEPGYDVSVNGVRGIVLYTTITNVLLRKLEDADDVVYVPNNFFVQYPVRRHIDSGSRVRAMIIGGDKER